MRRVILLLILAASACSAPPMPPQPTAINTIVLSSTSANTAVPSATSTTQPRLSLINYGPEAKDFPSNINPLTGREGKNPSLLHFPAVLVSISNMPVPARPKAGPGFAPWVYELYIGE